jgi:two-component system response regulator
MLQPILQVEDDPNDVVLLQHAMTKAGVGNPIRVATDGQQAIDYLKGAGRFVDRARFPLPCLVLLDLKLPYVMGLNVLKWIRQQPGMALVVIMLTASGEDADIASAYRLGANAFLTKPSNAGRLEEMAKAIKDFWLTHNTLPQKSHSGAAAPALGRARAFANAANRRPPVNKSNHEKLNYIEGMK